MHLCTTSWDFPDSGAILGTKQLCSTQQATQPSPASFTVNPFLFQRGCSAVDHDLRPPSARGRIFQQASIKVLDSTILQKRICAGHSVLLPRSMCPPCTVGAVLLHGYSHDTQPPFEVFHLSCHSILWVGVALRFSGLNEVNILSAKPYITSSCWE